MSVIEVKNLTKQYEFNKGIYDVTFNVEEGEVVGFLGPNGAGKSTTMRHLMGFSLPNSGYARIFDYDCGTQYFETKKEIGYLPGEPTLPQGLDGKAFIKMMGGLKGSYNNDRVKYLCDKFELDVNQDIKRMSIGEKRKLAIVAAFMTDAKVLLLDEPTSGLDPKMQEIFIDFILEEKKRGKTILLSSHIFSEVERLCDRILIIKDGKIAASVNADDVKHGLKNIIDLSFKTEEEYDEFVSFDYEFEEKNRNKRYVSIKISDLEMDTFIKRIKDFELTDFKEIKMTLEDYFMNFYKTRS